MGREEIFSGCWWRFSQYEVVDGWFIRPASAELTKYNPWEELEKARAGNGQGALESFLNLFDALEFVKADRPVRKEGQYREWTLDKSSEEQLTAWCSQNGLLGALLHQVSYVALHPVWRGVKPPYRPARDVYFRTNRGWSRTSETLDGPDGELLEERRDRRGKSVPIDELLPGVSTSPCVMLHDLGEHSVRFEPLSKSWGRYFPSVRLEDRETFRYPEPLTPRFWELYAEPIDIFVQSLLLLHGAMTVFTDIESWDKLEFLELDGVRAIDEGLETLNSLAGLTTPRVGLGRDRRLLQTWSSPSLLGMLAVMALSDLEGGRRFRRCESCKSVFSARNLGKKYCSPTCKFRNNKKTVRRNDKIEELTNQGSSPRQIARELETDAAEIRKVLERRDEKRSKRQSLGRV